MKKTIVILGLLLICPGQALASNRAGAVVHHLNGTEKTACVTFNEDAISDYELLKRAGFNPILDNNFVVSVDGERAKSYSGPGVLEDYWSYWVKKESWVYARSGTTTAKVINGQLDGWQRGGETLAISNLSFADVCPPVAESAQTKTNTRPPQADANPKTSQPEANATPNQSVPNTSSAKQSTQKTVTNKPKEIDKLIGTNLDKPITKNVDELSKKPMLVAAAKDQSTTLAIIFFIAFSIIGTILSFLTNKHKTKGLAIRRG